MGKAGLDHDEDAASSGSDGLQQGLTNRYRVHFPLNDAGGHDRIQEARDITTKYSSRARDKYTRRTRYQWAVAILPILGWLPKYNVKSWLIADVAAGLSVAAMVVPQGLSYAKLAGLPQVWGLYGAFSPCIVYAGFGSSKQLAVGPVAVTSLLLGNVQHGLGNLAGVSFPASVLDPATNTTVPYNPSSPGAYAPQQDAYNNAAHNVAFLAGLMYTVIGLLRLGWITQYLSQPVISGFMSGACITIAMSQVKYLMGLKVPRFDKLQDTCRNLVQNLNYFNWREYVMGMSFLILLEIFKFVGRKYKRLFFLRALGPLTVTIMSIAIMNIWKLYQPGKGGPNGIYTVGPIPKGLPGYTGNKFFPFVGSAGRTFGLSIVVCLIDLTESISIARALAIKNRYELEPTQELLAIGYANIVGALFNSYTTTGSFSRSAVNNSCGARTPLASLISGLAVMVVLLCLTTVFKNMSNNAQGAIIISGVITLFDYKTAVFLAKTNILDFIVWMATFLTVTFAGVEIGIAVGVGLSFLYVGLKIGFPHTAILGRLPGTNLYRNVKQYPEAQTVPGILIVRVDAPFYFASVHTIRDMLQRYEKRAQAEAAERGSRLSHIIMDLSSVAEVDATAVNFLFDTVRNHREAELVDEITGQKTASPIQILFANPSKQVVREFELADLVNYVKAESIFVDVSDAVAYAEHAQLTGQKLEEHTIA